MVHKRVNMEHVVCCVKRVKYRTCGMSCDRNACLQKLNDWNT